MLVTYFSKFYVAEWPSVWERASCSFGLPRVLFINCCQFMYLYSYFPFGLEGRIWDLIVSVADHCLSFYFSYPCHNFDLRTTSAHMCDGFASNKIQAGEWGVVQIRYQLATRPCGHM